MNPKMLADTLTVRKFISLRLCITQAFTELLFGAVEIILLTEMAYDDGVAIGKSLHYTAIMSQQVCSFLVAVAWSGALVCARIQIFFTVWLPSHGPSVIDHFMCDLYTLLKLVCMDTVTLGLFVAANSGFICFLNFLILMVSSVVILYSQKNYSLEGRHKALFTRVSHITVILFFVPCILVYLCPMIAFPNDKTVAVFYTMITSIIYILNNAEVKNAMKYLWIQRSFQWRNNHNSIK